MAGVPGTWQTPQLNTKPRSLVIPPSCVVFFLPFPISQVGTDRASHKSAPGLNTSGALANGRAVDFEAVWRYAILK